MRTITSETLRANATRMRRHKLFVTAENLDIAANTIDRLEGRLGLSLSRATDFRNALAALTESELEG